MDTELKNTYDTNNIFAKIIRKEIPSKLIFESEYVIAFHDIYPAAPVHVLVLPKGEFLDFSDFMQNASKELVITYFAAIEQIIKELGIKDYKLLCNKGEDAGQTIFHFHMHILSGTKLEHV